MKAFVAQHYQGNGDMAVCATEERAVQWVKDAITQHQAKSDPSVLTDPHPWEGWAWHRNNDGTLCFGVTDEISEATVKQFDILD